MRLPIIAATAFAAAIAAPLHADAGVILNSAVFVERSDGAAHARRFIEPASLLNRGDNVVMVLDWHAHRQSNGFVLTSPIPGTLKFQRSSRDNQEVSVDGGKSWGQIGQLRVADGGAWRFATPEDVTHIRWRIPADMATRGSGRVTYRALVR